MPEITNFANLGSSNNISNSTTPIINNFTRFPSCEKYSYPSEYDIIENDDFSDCDDEIGEKLQEELNQELRTSAIKGGGGSSSHSGRARVAAGAASGFFVGMAIGSSNLPPLGLIERYNRPIDSLSSPFNSQLNFGAFDPQITAKISLLESHVAQLNFMERLLSDSLRSLNDEVEITNRTRYNQTRSLEHKINNIQNIREVFMNRFSESLCSYFSQFCKIIKDGLIDGNQNNFVDKFANLTTDLNKSLNSEMTYIGNVTTNLASDLNFNSTFVNGFHTTVQEAKQITKKINYEIDTFNNGLKKLARIVKGIKEGDDIESLTEEIDNISKNTCESLNEDPKGFWEKYRVRIIVTSTISTVLAVSSVAYCGIKKKCCFNSSNVELNNVNGAEKKSLSDNKASNS